MCEKQPARYAEVCARNKKLRRTGTGQRGAEVVLFEWT